jgi:hypothetical protein
VRARLLAPWRVDKGDCSQPHGDTGKKTPNECAWKHLPKRRAGVLQQNREAAGRHHEKAETRSFHQIFWPVTGGGRNRGGGPGSVDDARLRLNYRLLRNSVLCCCLHLSIGFAVRTFVTR